MTHMDCFLRARGTQAEGASLGSWSERFASSNGCLVVREPILWWCQWDTKKTSTHFSGSVQEEETPNALGHARAPHVGKLSFEAVLCTSTLGGQPQCKAVEL